MSETMDSAVVQLVAQYLFDHPDARILDVMAEFDLSDSEATAYISAAWKRILRGESEREEP